MSYASWHQEISHRANSVSFKSLNFQSLPSKLRSDGAQYRYAEGNCRLLFEAIADSGRSKYFNWMLAPRDKQLLLACRLKLYIWMTL